MPTHTHTAPIAPKGFTLIELLLYIGIASVILLAASVFLSLLLESRIKNQTVTEVDQQGLVVMQLLTQTLRNAESAVVQDGALILETPDAATSPTTFSLANDALWIQSGADAPVSLTSDRVMASAFSCSDLSLPGAPSSLQCSFTLTHVNATGRHIYEYARTMHASASLR